MVRTKWPPEAPTVWMQTEGEVAVASLKGEVELNQYPKAVRAPCISKETRRMEYWRAALLWAGRAITREVCKARCDFQRALQKDRRRRVQASGLNIKGLLESGRVKEAWDHLER